MTSVLVIDQGAGRRRPSDPSPTLVFPRVKAVSKGSISLT